MDLLQRGINAAQDVRVVGAVTTDLTREACRRHQLRGPEAVVLGRALTAAALLATLTKNDDERVLLQIRGTGPLGRILADAHGDGTVRGCFGERPAVLETFHAAAAGRSIAAWVGASGQMTVTRDLGLEKQYQGIVELQSGEIDADLERYLLESEQLPSILACEVLLDTHEQVYKAAGVLCQTFPGADAAVLDEPRNRLRSIEFPRFLMLDRSPEDLMGFALGGASFIASAGQALRFHCNCGPERAKSVVSALGADDIVKLADEQPQTEVRCSFCGETYVLTRDDLLALAEHLRRNRS